MRGRFPGLLAVAIGATATCALALACSSFGQDETPTPTPPDGGSAAEVGPPREDGGEPPADGAPPLVEAGLDHAACPPSREPSCELTACMRRTLYTPASPEYPFGITTDANNVFWIAQPAGGVGSYDGHGSARVVRIGKALGAVAVEIATGQMRAEAVALDGDHVYWGTLEDGGLSKLMRARRDCGGANASCASEVAGTLPDKVVRLLRSAPGVLYGVTRRGTVLHLDTTKKPVVARPIASVGDFPSLTATGTDAYGASGTIAQVVRANAQSSSPSFATLPPRQDGGASIGLHHLASDCTSLWGIRPGVEGVRELIRVALDGGAAAVRATFPSPFDTYAMQADERYVYIANANAGGVVAYDTAVKADPITISSGNIFNVGVDADGVYWGEHGKDAVQAGVMQMLVK